VTSARRVVIGVDTHLETIHVAALTDTGQPPGDAEFGTTSTGYYVALRWAQSFGEVFIAGVEGTSSYGAGFTQALQGNEIHVVEVNRPDRGARRRQGKSDPLDAYSAARAVLAGHGLAVPKDPNTGGLKALLIACKALAQRIEFLERQTDKLTAELDALVTRLNPALPAAYRVGPDSAAQLLITAGTNTDRRRSETAFARLSGVAPIPASSGKTTRHRLSRGGDRAANNALHRIALVRWSHDPRTRDYVTRQLAAGRSNTDILRLLKRAIAREMFTHLTKPCPIDDHSDLRPSRQAQNITLTRAATHFGVWPNDISRLERGLKRDDTLAANYRRWLNTQLIYAA
jgi:transposase